MGGRCTRAIARLQGSLETAGQTGLFRTVLEMCRVLGAVWTEMFERLDSRGQGGMGRDEAPPPRRSIHATLQGQLERYAIGFLPKPLQPD